jgi:hypothetical protein
MRLVAVVNDTLGIDPPVDGRAAVARERSTRKQTEAREGGHDRTAWQPPD